MFDIKFSQFFDRADVMKHVVEGTKSVLSKLGAFVRRDAKGSIRRRKRSAEPGQPPSSHAGTLRDLIFFAYDRITDSVVIGPLLFKKRRSPTVPQLLEEGGIGESSKGLPATYNKFPFMEPAARKNHPKFPELFTDAIR